MTSDEEEARQRGLGTASESGQGRRWRRLVGGLSVAAIILVVVGLLAHATVRPWSDPPAPRLQLGAQDSSAPRPPLRRASEAERAFLRPLTEGSRLGGFEVRELRPVDKGSLRIVCERDGARVKLDVALLGPESPSPPAVVGHYAIYYSLERASQVDGERLAAALAKILDANAASPPPPGLRPYPADPRRLMEL